jgi:hypothetical protein
VCFATIRVADGLTRRERTAALLAGPPVPTGPDGAELATRAGFIDVEALDVTPAYLLTARAWLDARLRLREQLRPLGPEEYDDKVAQGHLAVAAIEAGQLERTLVAAARPRR